MFGWVAGRKQVMLPHCVTGWPDEGVWGLVRPPTAASTALSRTDGCLHVKAVTPTTTTHMHKHTAYDRGIVVTLCYTQLLSPLFMLHDYVMIWLYILVLTDPRPALRDTQQTLWAGQCHFACGSMPNRFKGVIVLAGDSQSAGWGEGSDSLTPLTCLLWNIQTLKYKRLVLCEPSLYYSSYHNKMTNIYECDMLKLLVIVIMIILLFKKIIKNDNEATWIELEKGWMTLFLNLADRV